MTVPEVQTYGEALARELAAALGEGPFTVAGPADRSGHLFGVRVPPGLSLPRLVDTLRQRNVFVSVRGSAVRVSPHVFNTPGDVHALAEALRAAG